jgi:hypothetical protein
LPFEVLQRPVQHGCVRRGHHGALAYSELAYHAQSDSAKHKHQNAYYIKTFFHLYLLGILAFFIYLAQIQIKKLYFLSGIKSNL